MKGPTPVTPSAVRALAELGRFATRSGLRRQTLTSPLTPLEGAAPANRQSRIRGGRSKPLRTARAPL